MYGTYKTTIRLQMATNTSNTINRYMRLICFLFHVIDEQLINYLKINQLLSTSPCCKFPIFLFQSMQRIHSVIAIKDI